MAKKSTNKSDFVRSQPTSMAASEVVAKAKEAGIVITKGLVYVVRSSRSGKKVKAPKAARSAKAGAVKAARGGKPSASDFIRSQPASASAKQVSDDGKKHGFSFKPALVYTVRRAQEKREKKAGGRASAGKHQAAVHHASSASLNELRKLIARFETVAASVLRELGK